MTKRRLGDYLDALKSLDELYEEINAEQKQPAAMAENGSKLWNKLQRLKIGTLRERLTLETIIGKFSKAE